MAVLSEEPSTLPLTRLSRSLDTPGSSVRSRLSTTPALPPAMQDAVQQLISLSSDATSTAPTLSAAAWLDVARAGKSLADSLRSGASPRLPRTGARGADCAYLQSRYGLQPARQASPDRSRRSSPRQRRRRGPVPSSSRRRLSSHGWSGTSALSMVGALLDVNSERRSMRLTPLVDLVPPHRPESPARPGRERAALSRAAARTNAGSARRGGADASDRAEGAVGRGAQVREGDDGRFPQCVAQVRCAGPVF